jgi:hypothetical protein
MNKSFFETMSSFVQNNKQNYETQQSIILGDSIGPSSRVMIFVFCVHFPLQCNIVSVDLVDLHHFLRISSIFANQCLTKWNCNITTTLFFLDHLHLALRLPHVDKYSFHSFLHVVLGSC